MREGLVGRLTDDGRPVSVSVEEIRGDGLLIVEFHGQQWILSGLNTRDIVDGQELNLGGKWEVLGAQSYRGVKSWRLKKVSQ